MKSFIPYNQNSDFSIYNIPFGIAIFEDDTIACVTRIGDTVVNLATLYDKGYFDEFDLGENVFDAFTLNEFIFLGKAVTVPVREKIQQLLLEDSKLSKDKDTIVDAFYSIEDVSIQMPAHVPNYTDFYSSIEHATNVGKMFRDPENALLPNWKHIPVGYHGR
ncbi:MAG: fumarylacetoacetase, partial [Moheibacter sp.]